MRLEDLKRWHWAIIGVLLGLLASYWRGSIGIEDRLSDCSTIDIAEFQQLLTRQGRGNQPLIRNIQIYPVEGGVYWVRADQLGWTRSRARREYDYMPVKLRTQTPFIPKGNPPPQTDSNFTVVDYLKSLKTKNPHLSFTLRWWDEQPTRSYIWGGAGLLLIGGVWPFIVNLLIGAGFGRRSEKAPEYDLDRFGQGEPAPATTAAPTHPSEADLAQLHELEAEMERNLAASQSATSAAPSASDTTNSRGTDQPIRPLTGGPVEAIADKTPAAKEYQGEYYPTETHGKNKK